MKFLGNILEKINNFDAFYEMSDDIDIYNKYTIIKSQIEEDLEKLTEDELTKLNKQLNKNGKIVINRYFNYYEF